MAATLILKNQDFSKNALDNSLFSALRLIGDIDSYIVTNQSTEYVTIKQRTPNEDHTFKVYEFTFPLTFNTIKFKNIWVAGVGISYACLCYLDNTTFKTIIQYPKKPNSNTSDTHILAKQEDIIIDYIDYKDYPNLIMLITVDGDSDSLIQVEQY